MSAQKGYHDGSNQSDPKCPGHSDAARLRHSDLAAVKPGVEGDNAAWERNPPATKAKGRCESNVITGVHIRASNAPAQRPGAETEEDGIEVSSPGSLKPICSPIFTRRTQ